MARGGARPGAGRPKGSKNRLTPAAQETFTAFVNERLETYLERLHELAMTSRPLDAIRALELPFERAYGKVPSEVQVKTEGTAQTVADLLGLQTEGTARE